MSGKPGDYAPERLTLGHDRKNGPDVNLWGVEALISAPVPGATTEVWLLTVGGNPENDADFAKTGWGLPGDGGIGQWALLADAAVQFRVRSGGKSGVLELSASAV